MAQQAATRLQPEEGFRHCSWWMSQNVAARSVLLQNSPRLRDCEVLVNSGVHISSRNLMPKCRADMSLSWRGNIMSILYRVVLHGMYADPGRFANVIQLRVTYED